MPCLNKVIEQGICCLVSDPVYCVLFFFRNISFLNFDPH